MFYWTLQKNVFEIHFYPELAVNVILIWYHRLQQRCNVLYLKTTVKEYFAHLRVQ